MHREDKSRCTGRIRAGKTGAAGEAPASSASAPGCGPSGGSGAWERASESARVVQTRAPSAARKTLLSHGTHAIILVALSNSKRKRWIRICRWGGRARSGRGYTHESQRGHGRQLMQVEISLRLCVLRPDERVVIFGCCA
eukprot:842581-Pleurochrysis_carterae.AAC.1